MNVQDRNGNTIVVGDYVVWVGGFVAQVKSITGNGITISGCKDIIKPYQVISWNAIEKNNES